MLKSLYKLQKFLIIEVQWIKPLKYRRISTKNLRTFEKLKEHSKDIKNLKNDKSLTNSKLEIHCKDRLIHLSNQSEENFAFDSISQKK